jgi:hypothetical protein
MTELRFEVLDIVPDPGAAAPTLTARLRITEATGAAVHAIALRAQVRIEPQRRPYGPAETEQLRDLFGERHQWGATLKPFVWVHAATMVPGFTGSIEAELALPCTYDFDVAAGKYLHAVREGDIPLVVCFSGTVFSRGAGGAGPIEFSVEQLRWDADVEHRMPATTWRRLMDRYFPGGGWIRLDEGMLDLLRLYRARHGFTSWEETIGALMGAGGPLAANGAGTAP